MNLLEGPNHTHMDADIGRHLVELAAFKENLSCVGRVDSGQDIEKSRLTSAVGADQAADPAGRHLEADVVQCNQAAEPLRHSLYIEQQGRRGHSFTSATPPFVTRAITRPLLLA